MDGGFDLRVPPALESLETRGPLALFLDFDGTLVEIASEPDLIEIPEGLNERLRALAAKLDGALALVTGRSVDNLTGLIGATGLHVAGSHGGHVVGPNGDAMRVPRPLPSEVAEDIQAFADEHGLLHERKSHGAALHFRARLELEHVTRSFAETLARRHGLATKAGKAVVEIIGQGIDKGSAVQLLASRAPFRGRTPIFIGDDITDEDGFAACDQLGGFGIRVGQCVPTAAHYGFGSVEDVYAWLNL